MTQSAAQSSPQTHPDYDLKYMANALRALAMDAVQKANSGHPGMPMGMADVATVLYTKFLKFDPQAPAWPDRDRFVLSAGHGSMLLYALNHLTGYEAISMDDIKRFRQLHSVTAGHPEYELHAGIETTTGPLGQGISTAVGMALGERITNAKYGSELCDHFTYVIASDGDLMEGISHEACSMAGHLKLSKLIVLYDDNGISIDGPTDLSFTDNTPKRFEAYGWHVQTVDGHDFAAIEKAIAAAQKTDTPSMICCKTHIGYGAPTKQDSSSSHGAPLGDDEIAGAKKNLGWEYGAFEIPDDVRAMWLKASERGKQARDQWQQNFANSDQSDAFEKAQNKDFSKELSDVIQTLKTEFAESKPKSATRALSGKCLEKLAPALPILVGGSADLTGSNKTQTKSMGIVSKDNYDGQYIFYGVREHAMAAAMNGIALHGGCIPFGGTFLIFTDYCRPAIRLSALMKQQVVYVMTHDSIGLGEDGPTHQPVEHLAALRAIPNTFVFRPCDAIETAESWELALKMNESPSILALTRQNLPALRENTPENLSAKGAYILKESGDEPDITLFASGSEVEIANKAYETLVSEGHTVRLVSVPCMDLFWMQDGEYIQNLICNKSLKIAVEAGIRQGWDGIIGPHSPFIGMNSFGASAPAEELYAHFKITADNIVNTARECLKNK